MEPSDRELIEATAGGEVRAFAEFVRRHTAAVLRYCLDRLRERHGAEDATQEAMLRMFQQARNGRVPDDPLTWLLSLARNCCHEQTRRRLKHQAQPLEPGSAVAADSSQRGVDLSDLLEQLTDAERGLIHMKHTEGLTCREIAERTGKPIGTVTATLAYAYARLRKRAGARPKDPKP
jgi:RNA polymerase sigma-70 factor (ECF subfamily)